MCSTLGGGAPRVATASSTNSLSVLEPQRAVVLALEADRGGRLVVDPGAAAGRAAEVAGPDLDVVGQRQQPLVQGAVDARRALALLDRQVGSRHVADEQRVAGQHRPGIPAARVVAEQEGGVLGPMAGRVERLDLGRRPGSSLQPSVNASCGYSASASSWMWIVAPVALREPAVARDVVGVVVGLEHVLDPDAVQAAEPQVGLDRPTAGRSRRRRPRRCRRPGRRRSSRSSWRIWRNSTRSA